MKIKIKDITNLCIKALQKKGINKKDSKIIVDEYLYAELSGKKPHGFFTFKNFATDRVPNKKVKWKIIKEEDNYALIDAKENLGQIVGKYAMGLAIKKARKKGIALVGMNNMQSYLMPGYYAKIASDNNMIGIVIDNSKSAVAPYGGIEPKLGTNPIGISFPTKNVPFILDMATSTRAMGEIRFAKRFKKQLPEKIALDENGNFTTNPDKSKVLTSFGYKGYGLAIAIEVLAGAFINAKMGSKIKKGTDRGFLFLVIDPTLFVSLKRFKEEVSNLLHEIKSSKKAKGTKEILIPGERASKELKNNLKKGYLEINDDVINEIKELTK